MKDPLEPYWTALGKFLHRYALLEQALNRVLRETTKVDRETAKAIFSGARVAQAISFINRVHEGKGTTKSPWLERAFPKVSELTTARDKILHNGFTLRGSDIIVSDRERTIPRAVYERAYTVTELYDLEADTCVAHACINMATYESIDRRRYRAARTREEQIALTPWRHKPRAPKQSQPSTLKAAQKP